MIPQSILSFEFQRAIATEPVVWMNIGTGAHRGWTLTEHLFGALIDHPYSIRRSESGEKEIVANTFVNGKTNSFEVIALCGESRILTTFSPGVKSFTAQDGPCGPRPENKCRECLDIRAKLG